MKTARLGERLAEQLKTMIRQGKWPQGKRLPGERLLAETLGVSRPTLREALDELARAGLIDRVDKCGNFVAFRKELRLALVFPEKEFLMEMPPGEHTLSLMEIQRGIFCESARRGVQTMLLYVPEPENDEVLERTLLMLREYDASLFFSIQLRELRLRLTAKRPVICYGSNRYDQEDCDACSSVFQDNAASFRQLVRHVQKLHRPRLNGIGNLGIWWCKDHLEELQSAAEAGKLACDILSSGLSPEEVLKKSENAALYLLNTHQLPDYYAAAQKLGWQIGREVELIVRGSGISLQNLRPLPTLMRIPYFQIGIEMVNVACRQIADAKAPVHELLPVEIIDKYEI